MKHLAPYYFPTSRSRVRFGANSRPVQLASDKSRGTRAGRPPLSYPPFCFAFLSPSTARAFMPDGTSRCVLGRCMVHDALHSVQLVPDYPVALKILH